MPDTRITIRGLDHELYQRLRVYAVEERISIGRALNEAIDLFLESPRNLTARTATHAPARVEGR